MIKWIQYHKEGEPISFMDNSNKEMEGIVHTVHIEIDKYQKRIWYDVGVAGIDDLITIDGETFRKV